MDQQNGLFGFLENHVMGPMGKLAQFKVVRAITAAGMAAVPFTIVGSMFLVFSILPQAFSFWPIVADIFSASFDKFTSLYMVANYATMGSLSLYFVLSLAYELTKIYAEEEELNMNPLNGALLALMAFIMTVPQIIFDGGMMKAVGSLKEGAVVVDGWAMGNGVTRFGTTGIFTAIIMAIVTVLIYRTCVKRNWVIKMPDGVPPAVTQSFAALIPSAFAMFFFFVVYLVFSATDYQYAHNFIYKILQAPLMGFGQSLIFEPIYQFLSTLFWFFGINGPAVTNTVFNPIHLALTAENLEAFKQGATLPNIFTGPFGDFFGNFGGGGSTLSLVFLMVFFGKSERMKKLGRLAIVPGIFGINEMIIFGLPVVLNPLIVIPFILTPLVNTILSTIATLIGLIPYTTGAALPWTTPFFFSGWLATGSIVAGLFQIVLIIIGMAIYYPFFRVIDKQYLHEEHQAANSLSDELDELSLDDLSFDDL